MRLAHPDILLGAALAAVRRWRCRQSPCALTHERIIAWSNPLRFEVRNRNWLEIGIRESGALNRSLGFIDRRKSELRRAIYMM